ncbi:hypothetical protein C5167_006012 [Papaver somniferum]|uniref:Uncharacterized protein n=1 Tax=Papaver somniferum TaxID=3469 RepID=A0A4Y7JC50_PAPSO|nr:hypothetical protein C5167_006012 [Papaver somniferum]
MAKVVLNQGTGKCCVAVGFYGCKNVLSPGSIRKYGCVLDSSCSFWVTVAQPLPPVNLTVTSLPADG